MPSSGEELLRRIVLLTQDRRETKGSVALFAYHILNLNAFETRTPAPLLPECISHL
jgi:hypothetical protein